MKFQPVKHNAACMAIAALGIFTNGCVSSKPDVTATSQPMVSVSEAQQDESLPLSPESTIKALEQSADVKSVRWGGTIARIENRPDKLTVLEIVARPLRSNGRPLHNDSTSGRYIALVKQFLDPVIVKVGRDITVVGPITHRQSGKVGETDYVFPIVAAESYKYWPIQRSQSRPQRHLPHWNTHLRPRIYDRWDTWPHRYPFPPRRPHRRQ